MRTLSSAVDNLHRKEPWSSTYFQHEFASHVREPPWKWLLQPQSSLQMSAALADMGLQLYEGLQEKTGQLSLSQTPDPQKPGDNTWLSLCRAAELWADLFSSNSDQLSCPLLSVIITNNFIMPPKNERKKRTIQKVIETIRKLMKLLRNGKVRG